MGAVCCKSKKRRVAPILTPDLEVSSMLPLKERTQFQKAWEEKQGEQPIHIETIWGLTIPKRDIAEVYVFDKASVGAGHYGSVWRAKHKLNKQKIFAVKSVNKTKLNGNVSLFKNELELLRFSDHPHLVRFFEIYQDFGKYYFILEFCDGGDLTTRIMKEGAMSEEDARYIMFQALLAINHLHACGIVHRDIKADNYLFKTTEADSDMKLTDFGLSKYFQPGSKMHSMVGTPFYVAPEVVEKRGYNEKIDLWSIGVVFYMLVTAEFPFRGITNNQTFDRIKRGEYSMTASKQLMSMSQEGKALLKKLLERDPAIRVSAREALRDPWFTRLNVERFNLGKNSLSKQLLERLKSGKQLSRLAKEIIRLMVILYDDDSSLLQLKYAYSYIDVLNNGILRSVELLKVADEMGEPMSIREADALIASLGLRSKKALGYTDFLVAGVHPSFYTAETRMKQAFKLLDIDCDGFLSASDLIEYFARIGVEINSAFSVSLFSEVNSSEKLSYDQIKQELQKPREAKLGLVADTEIEDTLLKP